MIKGGKEEHQNEIVKKRTCMKLGNEEMKKGKTKGREAERKETSL